MLCKQTRPSGMQAGTESVLLNFLHDTRWAYPTLLAYMSGRLVMF